METFCWCVIFQLRVGTKRTYERERDFDIRLWDEKNPSKNKKKRLKSVSFHSELLPLQFSKDMPDEIQVVKEINNLFCVRQKYQIL